MMGCRAADADPVDGKEGQPPCKDHDGQRQQSPGDGKEKRGNAAPEQGTQKAPHPKDLQGGPAAQKVQGKQRYQVCQPQLDARQRDQHLQGDKPFHIG